MAIYFFDKNQTLIKIVPESATFEAIQTQELDDDSLLKDTLSVTIKGDEKLLDAEYMAVKSYTGNAQTFDMYRIVTDATPDKSMSFTGMSLAPYELNGHIIQDLRPANHSLSYTLNRVLDGTDWRVGYIEDGLSNVTTTFYYVSVKEALKELQSLVGCEFVFKVEISGQKITDKWIEVYSEMGNRTKKRFNYGTNALTVVRETNKADIYTALIGRGKGEEVTSAEDNESGQAGYGRKITFEDIEWSTANGNPLNKPIGQYYLELPQATQAYGIKNIDGTMKARVGIVDFDDEEDKNRLINLTYQQLLVSSRPKVLFKTTVANIGATGIGDTVTIHRHDLNIHYQTRVRKIVRNKLNDNKTQIELGDAVVTPSTKQTKQNNATIKNLNNEIEKIKANVTTSQNSADGKNTIFYGSAEPERQRTGDTWYRPHPSIAGETQMLTWNGTAWELVIDTSDLTSVSRGVQDAISKAEEAKELAVSEADNALAQAKADATTKANAIKEQISGEVNTAITTAEDAKQTAIDGYNNAIAETERLVGEQSATFNKKFEENASSMNTLSQATKDAEVKAQSALTKAGANANLLSTHQNTLDTINTVTLPDIASSAGTALANAKSAMDEAKEADNKIANFVTTNGLVSGTTVDNKINEATGEISRKITTVESKIPTELGGTNLLVGSAEIKLSPATAYGTFTYLLRSNIISIASKVKVGDTLTFSFDIWSEETTGIRIYDSNGNPNMQFGSENIIATPDKKRLSFTKTLTLTSKNDLNNWYMDFYNNNNGIKFWVENIKIEKGSIPSDWSPAPEDNYTQEEFKIFESTYNEDVKGINSSLTELSNKKLDGTTYTTFYDNEYKKTAQGVTDAWTAVNKIIDANGNSTDTFAKAVYDKNATRQSADFKSVTDGLVKTATYEDGINGVKKSISSVEGKIDDLSGARNLLKESWHNSEESPRIINSNYLVKSWDLTEPLKLNQKYTFRVFGWVNRTGFDLYTSNEYISLTGSLGSNNSEYVIKLRDTYIPVAKGRAVWEKTFTVTQDVLNNMTDNRVKLYHRESSQTGYAEIYWATLVEGTAGIDWSPSLTDQLGKAEFTIFKSDYEETAKSVERRLTAIDSSEEGSVVTRLNKTESTASGNSALITTINNSYVTQKNINESILSDKQIKDTRNDNQPPSWYYTNYPKQTVKEFKFSSVMGVGSDTYGMLTTDVQWTDKSGGTIKQQFATSGVVYNRVSNYEGTAWLPWSKQIDTADKTYQKVTQTSSLYERVLGSTDETGVKNNISRVVQTSGLIQQQVLGVSGQSLNLIVRKDEYKNKLLGSGVLVETTNGSAVMKDKIPVVAGEMLTFTKTTSTKDNSWRIEWYDSNDKFMSRLLNTNNLILFQVPQGASYLWVSYPMSSNVQLERGEKRTPWKPSLIDIQDGYGGRNLLKNSDFSNKLTNWGLNNGGKVSQVGDTNVVKVIAGSTYSGLYQTIDNLDIGEIYTFSVEVKGKGSISIGFDDNRQWYPLTEGVWSKLSYTTTYESRKVVIFYTNTTDTEFEIRNLQVERGMKATDWTPNPEDTNSKITQLADSINLRVTKQGLLSQINVQAGGILIQSGTNKLNITQETTFIKDATIKSAMIDTIDVKKITGITADFTTMITKGLTANVITSTMIKADDAMFSKLFATKLATDKLVAQGAWITDANIVSLDAGTIKSGTIDSARIDAEYIVTNGLSSNVVQSKHIKAESGLVGKLFSTTAYIEELTNKTVFTEKIQAINISADKIKTGTLDAGKVKVVNLDANNITANKTEFIQSSWNDINAFTQVDASGIQMLGSGTWRRTFLSPTGFRMFNGVDANNKAGAIGYFKSSADLGGGIDNPLKEDFMWQNLERHTVGIGVNDSHLLSLGYQNPGANSEDGYNPAITIDPQKNGQVTISTGARANLGLQVDGTLTLPGGDTFTTYNGLYLNTSYWTIKAKTGVRFFVGDQKKLHVGGNVELGTTLDMAGNVITGQSDYRLKKNIETLNTNDLDKLTGVRMVSYEWIDPERPQGTHVGFIAQELQEVYPEFITENNEGILSINNSELAMAHVHATQELNAKVDEHISNVDNEVAKLKAQIASLQDELALLKGA